MNKCRSCFYHWFKNLKEFCTLHEKKIKRPVGCPDFQDAHKKVMPDKNGNYDYGY
jgi:hypothetical protein